MTQAYWESSRRERIKQMKKGERRKEEASGYKENHRAKKHTKPRTGAANLPKQRHCSEVVKWWHLLTLSLELRWTRKADTWDWWKWSQSNRCQGLISFSFGHGEGNGTPLQYSCLENPRDSGACWAAIYGVAQSRTRLTWLSSSSSFAQDVSKISTPKRILGCSGQMARTLAKIQRQDLSWGLLFGIRTSQVALVVKNPPANAGDVRDTGLIPGQEDPKEEVMATHSSILAWRIPWTEEPEQLKSMGSQSRTRLKWLSMDIHTHFGISRRSHGNSKA